MEPIIPIYYQIRRTIKRWILNKQYGTNDKIPSEHELAATFDVNRMTVRQALSSLVGERILIRKRGEGTFVTPNPKLINQLNPKPISMTNDLFMTLMKSKTLAVVKTEIEPNPLIREKLELSQDDRTVIKIQRDRIVPDKIRAFTTNYLPLDIGSRLDEEEMLKKSLSAIMEEDLKIQFTEAFQTLEVSFANEETAAHLEIAPGAPILFTERIMYDENGKPVELVNTIYNASMYKYCLKLKKIKRGSAYDWICQFTG